MGCVWLFCFCKQKTAYEMRISDWSSDVCSSDLLVAAVSLEQALAEVVDRGAGDALVEVALHVAGLEEADVGAEALDRADPGEGGHERLRHPGADEVAGLSDVREVLRPGLEGHVDRIRAEGGAALSLPGLDGRDPVPGAGRHVGTVVIEAPVAADAAGRSDERRVGKEGVSTCRSRG